MSFYSAILRNSIYPYILKHDGHTKAQEYYEFFMESQYWSREKLLNYQNEKLVNLLNYAYKNCPFYSKAFDSRGLKPADIQSPADLVKLPILKRQDLFDHRDEIVSRAYDINKLVKKFSGGSTGIQAEVYRNENTGLEKLGMSWRHDNWMGRERCDKLAYLWPAAMDLVGDVSWKFKIKTRYLLREVIYNAGAAKEAAIRKIHDDYTRFNPEYIKCFPSALFLYVTSCQKLGLRLNPVKGILSTGEPLYPHQRQLFEEVYQANIVDMYGARETGNNACECSRHNGLHIAVETCLVEFIKDGRQVKPGEEGEIFITDFTNEAFPLIRYQINDYGMPLEGECDCGRSLPRMTAGVGRIQDDIFAPDGTRLSGITLCVHLTNGLTVKIGQVQVIQTTLDNFRVVITDEPKPDQVIYDFIDKTMKTIISPDINVEIEVVKEIPFEKSGKFRALKSELPEEVKKRLNLIK